MIDRYVTGAAIKRLREERSLTQSELAGKLNVSDKAVSKWETGRGYPDITLLEPLAAALNVSTIELMQGEAVINRNRSGNMLKSQFYVCPLCGNIVTSAGAAVISCCGITLPPLEAEETDEEHRLIAERVEDEWYITAAHEMTKEHFLTFAALAQGDRLVVHKWFPEGNAETRFKVRGHGILYVCCNRHGLFRQRI